MENKKETILKKTVVVWLLAMVCCALWGSAFPCVKIGYRLMNISSDDSAAQLLYAGCRFFLAGVLVILMGSIGERKFVRPRMDEWKSITLLSLFQTILQYVFFYIGLAHTSGVKASIIEGMNVFVAMLIAAWLFHMEKLTVQKIVGCLIGFAGVVLINVWGSGLEAGLAWNGEGFIFISTVAYGISSGVIKLLSKEHDTVMLSGYQFLFGGVVLAVLGFLMGGRLTQFSVSAAVMLLYLAFISAAAYTLWGILLKYNPVSKVAVFGFMNPVFGVILSALLLNEGSQIGISSLLALILVCSGIYIVNRSPKQREVQ